MRYVRSLCKGLRITLCRSYFHSQQRYHKGYFDALRRPQQRLHRLLRQALDWCVSKERTD